MSKFYLVLVWALLMAPAAWGQTWFVPIEYRVEFLLKTAPSAVVLDFLEGQYPKVRFVRLSTENGFVAEGSKSDLLHIKRELASLDRVIEPRPPLREFIRVQYGNLSDLKSLVRALHPNIQVSIDEKERLLIVEGTPAEIDLVRESFSDSHYDLTGLTMVDLKLVHLDSGARKSKLGVTFEPLEVKTTVIVSEMGKVVRTYQQPPTTRFSSATLK